MPQWQSTEEHAYQTDVIVSNRVAPGGNRAYKQHADWGGAQGSPLHAARPGNPAAGGHRPAQTGGRRYQQETQNNDIPRQGETDTDSHLMRQIEIRRFVLIICAANRLTTSV